MHLNRMIQSIVSFIANMARQKYLEWIFNIIEDCAKKVAKCKVYKQTVGAKLKDLKHIYLNV